MKNITGSTACQGVEKDRCKSKTKIRFNEQSSKEAQTSKTEQNKPYPITFKRGYQPTTPDCKGYINNRGITIIELLVAVAIVGILATLAINRYRTFVLKTKIQEAVLMLKHIQEMSDAYYANHGLYPTQDGTYLLIADKSLGDSNLAGHWYYDMLFGKTEQRLKEMGISKPSGDSRFWYYAHFWGFMGSSTRIVYAYPKTRWDWYGFSEEECDNTLENVTVAIDNDGSVYVWGVPGLNTW